MVSLLVETKTVDSQGCLTYPVNDVLSVRLYSDNKPVCLETAALQKGLVLVYKGKEVIEEGIGFGVPVIKYQDKTVFSGTAQILQGKSLGSFEKHFWLDTVSTKRFYKTPVNDTFYEAIHKLFEKAYLGHQTMQPINNKIMELREILKIKTEFRQIKPRGVVKVRYDLTDKAVNVSADYSGVNVQAATEILSLNEQGASCFPCYKDADGVRLFGCRIGAWDMVKAETATLISADDSLAFSLEPKVSARLFRGWEQTKNRFSWAGLSYSLPPNVSGFDYRISLVC